jgi:hypothetical protein
VQRFEEQLKALRMKHSVLRADSAVACWEEKAIAQRLKRRHAEAAREQLQQAEFAYMGFVRSLKSVFTEAVPPRSALNMQHFLHKYTHLRRDPQLRAQDLGAIGSAVKLDRAMQMVLRETAAMPVSTSPEIRFEELDLGTEALGKTSTSVYAFNTRDASKAFGVACNAVLTTCGVWPDHSRVESSTRLVDVPPTEFNVTYGITRHTYQHNTTNDRSCTEARDLYYSSMVGSCGVLVWDFVDAGDLYPLKCTTFINRNTVGAYVPIALMLLYERLTNTLVRYARVVAGWYCALRSARMAWSEWCAASSAPTCRSWWTRRSHPSTWPSSRCWRT